MTASQMTDEAERTRARGVPEPDERRRLIVDDDDALEARLRIRQHRIDLPAPEDGHPSAGHLTAQALPRMLGHVRHGQHWQVGSRLQYGGGQRMPAETLKCRC